nr:uncharacterized protein LOC105318426 isoform X1 [Crassostrea gigas]XP_011413853.2 uncharacterized protein LOC105318426 isoform X1 [Crassostrea gigas]
MPSKINSPISADDAQRIKKNWGFLNRNLDQNSIRGDFMDEDVWVLLDFQEIDAEKTPQKRNEVFLKLLLRSGPRAYKIFIAALKKQSLNYIVQKLESTKIIQYTETTMQSQIDQPISADDAQRIEKNMSFLTQQLAQDAIRDNFIEQLIWDVPHFEEIDGENTPQKRNEVFLKLLLRSGPKAYGIFIAALKNHNSDHIVKKLESTKITQNNQAVLDHFASLTDDRKTHVLVNTDLLKFNKVVGSDIEIFGKALQLKQADIDGIRMVNSLSVPTQVHQIIQMWKSKNGKLATLGRFTKNLMDAEAAGARIYWDVFDQGVKEVTS